MDDFAKIAFSAELEVLMTGTDGLTRRVNVNPGDVLHVHPGETVTFPGGGGGGGGNGAPLLHPPGMVARGEPSK